MAVTPGSPLADATVVSLAVNLPGPLAAARLTALGAEVVKVEPPSGDPLRSVAPEWYEELVTDQEILPLDLKEPGDRGILEERLVGADALLTAMRPAALDRLGLRESFRRQGVVLVEIVGHDGERADEPGHDLTYQAVHGSVLPPAMPVVPVADMLGAERAVSAIIAGLRQRDRGQASPHHRVVLDEAARDAAAGVRHGLTGPGDVLGGALAAYGIYATKDGHVAVAAIEPHFTERLRAAVGRTRDELTERFAGASNSHWESLGRDLDIPIVAVRDPRTIRSFPHRSGPIAS